MIKRTVLTVLSIFIPSLLVLAMFSVGGSGGTQALAATSVKLLPVADSYTNSNAPNKNFGTLARLRANSSPVMETYLKFNLSSVQGTIDSATLTLYPFKGGNQPASLSFAGNGWTETGLTYNNRPATLSAIGTVSPVVSGTPITFNLGSLTAQTYSFKLGTTGNLLAFGSRESGQKPYAVLSVTTPTQSSTAPVTSSSPPVTSSSPPAAPVIAAVGDIACDPTLYTVSNCSFVKTAALVGAYPYDKFLPLGDEQYEDGQYSKFTNSYDLYYGQYLGITKPVPGNHEYNTTNAAGYYQYFGAIAGDPTKGYYSYNLGDWHIVAINSNCAAIGGCTATSPEGLWLQNDLNSHGNLCTLMYSHHPRWSSGSHGDNSIMGPFYQIADAAGVDVWLAGHDHNYQRFAPMDANRVADVNGIRQFVVGTGGAGRYSITTVSGNTQAYNTSTFGILSMTLDPTSYTWKFIPVAGSTYTDSGTTSCL